MYLTPTCRLANTVLSLAHARQTLRMLQDVSAGTREKFEITGCHPKRVHKGSKTKINKPKTNGIAKARQEKSTKPRNNGPRQQDPPLAMASSPPATQAKDANATDNASTDDVLDSIEGALLEYMCHTTLEMNRLADWSKPS